MLASLILAFAVSCLDVAPSAPELLRDALRAVERGDPRAWDLCEGLRQGEGRGMCRVAASATRPDRAAACEAIVRSYWRGECWFVYAESLAEAGRWDDAVGACEKTEAFVGDCGRHVWWIAERDGGDTPVLRRRLEALFEPVEVAPEPPTAPSRWRRAWRSHAVRIAPSTCPDTERAECVGEAKAAFAGRWRRAIGQDGGARLTLCAEVGHVEGALGTHGEPELEATLEDLRAELCKTP